MRPAVSRLTRTHSTGLTHAINLTASAGFIPSFPIRVRHTRGFAPWQASTPSTWDLRHRIRDIFDVEKWSVNTKLGVLFGGACSVYYLFHLERTPVTGRVRFLDVSPKQEQKLVSKEYQQLLAENEGKVLPPNHALVQYVRKVVGRVLEGSHLGRLDGTSDGMALGTPGDTWTDGGAVNLADHRGQANREWRVLVIDDYDVVNAMVANGTIIIYTGMLPVCKDESGLAAAVGHEIAHVVARHTAERLSSVRALTILCEILEVLYPATSGLPELVLTYAFHLPNSRTQELEADKIGLTLTAQACYDPQSALDLHKRLASLAPHNREFTNTHPASERRVKLLETYLPEAYSLQVASSLCADLTEQLGAFKDVTASSSEWSWSSGAGDNPADWR